MSSTYEFFNEWEPTGSHSYPVTNYDRTRKTYPRNPTAGRP